MMYVNEARLTTADDSMMMMMRRGRIDDLRGWSMRCVINATNKQLKVEDFFFAHMSSKSVLLVSLLLFVVWGHCAQ